MTAPPKSDKPTPQAVNALKPIYPKLRAFWLGVIPSIVEKHVKDEDARFAAMMSIEENFYPDLVKLLCEPFNLDKGACLETTMAVAQRSEEELGEN